MSIKHKKSGLKKGWTTKEKALAEGAVLLRKNGIAVETLPKSCLNIISDNSYLISLGCYTGLGYKDCGYFEVLLGKHNKVYALDDDIGLVFLHEKAVYEVLSYIQKKARISGGMF